MRVVDFRSVYTFFRSLREQCTWQHNFERFADARPAVADWIGCTTSFSLTSRSPRQHREYISRRGLTTGEHYTGIMLKPRAQQDATKVEARAASEGRPIPQPLA